MDISNAIIDTKRLELLKKSCTAKEAIKLEKSISKLFKNSNIKTLNLLNLFSRFDAAKSEMNSYNQYTIGKRELIVVNRQKQLDHLYKEVYKDKIIGFDTEQKPTFTKGQSQKPIAIIQLATNNYCYVIQMKFISDVKKISTIISDPKILKVGFGLGNDFKQLTKFLGNPPQSLLDLATIIKTNFDTKHPIGAKNAVAVFMKQKLQKSKNTALSNWENDVLNKGQVHYASEDATAPLDIYHILHSDYSYLID